MRKCLSCLKAFVTSLKNERVKSILRGFEEKRGIIIYLKRGRFMKRDEIFEMIIGIGLFLILPALAILILLFLYPYISNILLFIYEPFENILQPIVEMIRELFYSGTSFIRNLMRLAYYIMFGIFILIIILVIISSILKKIRELFK